MMLPVPLIARSTQVICPTLSAVSSRRPEMEQHIKDRLAQTLLKVLASADILESEGGIQSVDVRLMNSEVTAGGYDIPGEA